VDKEEGKEEDKEVGKEVQDMDLDMDLNRGEEVDKDEEVGKDEEVDKGVVGYDKDVPVHFQYTLDEVPLTYHYGMLMLLRYCGSGDHFDSSTVA
jgi:hypothetical protein